MMSAGIAWLIAASMQASAMDEGLGDDAPILWYDEPAAQWTEALPVGNGRLGAMVFGGVDEERIQLNIDSLWAGPPFPVNDADMADALSEARTLFFAGKPAAGEALVQERMMAQRISPRSHQTLGDLRLRMIYPDSVLADPVEFAAWRRGPADKGFDPAFIEPSYDDRAWPDVGDASGLAGIPEHRTVVFRTGFNMSREQIDGGLRWLELDPIDDASIIYLNGVKIGETTQWNKAHSFDVREALQVGWNVLAIAARNVGGPGHMAQRVCLVAKMPTGWYRRELDFGRAVAATAYDVGGVFHQRVVFASAAEDVIVVLIGASEAGSVSLDIALDRPADFETTTEGSNRLVMQGRATQNGRHAGVRYCTVVEARAHGGAVTARDNELKIRDADTVLLLLAAETDYNAQNPERPLSEDLHEACADTIDRVADDELGTQRFFQAHVKEHQRLFDRVTLDLGPKPYPDLPIDERLRRVAAGETDTNLEALYFQFGRYLLMCSSRPGTMAANLQGIWNEHIDAPWNADYHLNINVQMNYWPAEVTNLSECHEPLFDLMEAMMPAGRRLADSLGCDGIAYGHVSDAWLWTALQGRCVWGMWTMGAGWLSAHMMEHYRFTGDEAFLGERAYPFLRECSAFYLDWLIEDPKTGRLVSGPTTSPENTYIADGARLSLSMGMSMDQQIIFETFTNTLQAAAILRIDDAFTRRVEEALKRLAPTQIGEDGRLMEWAQPFEEAEPGHRHMSHLYALHPGAQITPRGTPELAAAARRTLEHRLAHGGGHTGWSRAWMINFGARLGDGDFAHEHLRLLLAKSTHPNLFDDHPPFQIDGNFGGCAGVAEMLLQSHDGEIELLPALPQAWPAGSITGLCARGGFVVEIDWAHGRLSKAVIHSRLGGTCAVRYGSRAITLVTEPGGRHVLDASMFAGP